jgi:hypothetical protein
VWLGDDISANNSEQRLFIARYLEKCPISLKRVEILDNELDTTIRYYKKEDSKEQYRDFSPLHFLAELSQHIPDMWEQTTRYYGAYSARTRGAQKRDERFRALLENNFEPLEITNVDQKRPTQYWATWIKKVFEIDPLECPKCGGEMKIKAFVFNQKEISRICKNLGIKDWRAPPPIKSSSIRVDYSTEFQQ